jgi:pimeloyl-ACP methyl ester carboxylesterase
VTGDEDILTGPPEAELMRRNIAGSELKIVRHAGHYSPWEQGREVGKLLRQFFDNVGASVPARA